MKFTSIAFFLLFSSFTIIAQNDFERNGVDTNYSVPVGLKVGEKAPMFSVKDIDGNKIDIKKVLQENSIVLIFYRGEWCPYCERFLSNLYDSLAFITEKRARIIAVGPETTENAKKIKTESGATYTLISDGDEKIMTKYDVLFHVNESYQEKIKSKLHRNISEANGQDEAHLPVPATYVIGQDGTILFVHFDYNYRIRPNVSTILNALD